MEAWGYGMEADPYGGLGEWETWYGLGGMEEAGGYDEELGYDPAAEHWYGSDW